MRTINRYIIKEVMQTFFVAFFGMTALLILVGLVREMMEKDVPLDIIMRLIPFVMLEMSRISIPVTFLLAVTTFYARMSGNNEIIALKSSGIAPWRILMPIMIIGLLMSLGTIWLSDMAITWGRNGMTTVIYNAAEDIILNQLRTNHRFSTGNNELTIMVKGVENRRLISPTISIKGHATTIEAKYAQLKIDFIEQELTVILNQVKLNTEGDALYISDNRIFKVPLGQVVAKGNEDKRPADMGLAEILQQREHYISQHTAERRRIAAVRTFGLFTGSVHDWNHAEVTKSKSWISGTQSTFTKLYSEPPRRWATGFSCLFFVWVGAPLAIWLKKQDVFFSFFACFIPVLILYYPLLMLGMQGAKKGTMPPESVWIANIVTGIVGLWFIKRIHRY